MPAFSDYDRWKLRSPDDDRPPDEFEPELEDMTEADWLEKQELEMSEKQPQTSDETGWLVELRGNVPQWWTLYGEEPHWTADSLKALRFARQEDAEAYIADIGWTEAFASEHIWAA